MLQVHISVPNVQQFIDMLTTVPAKGYDNAFTYVMSEWTKLQGNRFLLDSEVQAWLKWRRCTNVKGLWDTCLLFLSV